MSELAVKHNSSLFKTIGVPILQCLLRGQEVYMILLELLSSICSFGFSFTRTGKLLKVIFQPIGKKFNRDLNILTRVTVDSLTSQIMAESDHIL